tara:strand:+ start:1601 stop:2425 length:825 start_codon:yes stop_codon:yes gene_type:complete
MEKYNLNNKTALITGASGLLGIKHAEALLQLSCDVVLTDIDIEKLLTIKKELKSKYKNLIRVYQMDVTSENNITEILKNLNKKKIRIDILINNAAINPKQSSIKGNIRTTRLENFSLSRWNQELSVGLTGAFLCSKIFGSKMAKDNKGGVILNISSDLSVIAPDQRIYRQDDLDENLQAVKPITYSVIKTGLIGLTRYLSSYWPNKNIRANALSPGGVFTNQDKEFVTKLSSLIPLGRMANLEEYMSAVQFLCSDASKYMTGQNIVIDGGRSVI